MQLPMIIGLHRSSFLDRILPLLVVMTSLVCWLGAYPIEIKLGLLGLVWRVGFLSWRALSPKIRAIRLAREGGISFLVPGQSEYVDARLLPGGTVHPWLTSVALLASDGRRHRLLVTVGTMSPEEFRRLRVFLRWQAAFSESGDGA